VEFSVVHVILGMLFYGKTMEKVYITFGPIIKNSLYDLKTFAERFHEHFAESLSSLGFENTINDPEIWIVDKSLHNESFDIYVDDILIWSKDPMAVINYLEKIYILKNVDIPE
jgi:hypothetical protein